MHQPSRRSRSWASSDVAGTEAVAAALAPLLRPGDLVTVRGPLGAGKTAFVRGACRALGVDGPVTSPTYTVGHRYAGAGGPVAHLDLYRSPGLDEEAFADVEPLLEGAVTFVEWPEAGRGLLPTARADVAIETREGDARLITITSGDRPLIDALGRSLA